MSKTPKTFAKETIGAKVNREERVKLFKDLASLERLPNKEFHVTKAQQVFPNAKAADVMAFFCAQNVSQLYQPGFVSHKEPVDPGKPLYDHVGARWYVEWGTGHWGVEEILSFDKEACHHAYIYGRASDPNHAMVKYLYEQFSYTQQGNDTLVTWDVRWVPNVNSFTRFLVQPLVSSQSYSNISKALAFRLNYFQDWLNSKQTTTMK